MNGHLYSSGRVIEIDQAISHNLSGEKFVNHQFQRLVARKKKFTGCDFSYSEFDAAYIRKCTFDSCNFTGCKFTNSNLRGSKFIGCKFDYAQFCNTHVEAEILDEGCPGQENLQQLFARTLRINFHQTGDSDASNKAIKIELNATRVHLKKAWCSRESYYRKKYKGIQRIDMFLKWLYFVVMDFIWGNGESSIKLVRSLVFLVVLIAVVDILLSDVTGFSTYTSALCQAPGILLGIAIPAHFPGLVLVVIAILRYVMFAMLVSILIKRMSKR